VLYSLYHLQGQQTGVYISLTKGIIYTYRMKFRSMTDRWLSFFDILASAFPILSAVRYSQFLPGGVMYQATSTCTYFQL